MADFGETELEMVRRHVCEGERHVARQREIVADFPADSEVAGTARTLLAAFAATLKSHCEHLRRLERN